MPSDAQCNLCPGLRAMCTACETVASEFVIAHTLLHNTRITESLVASVMPVDTHPWRVHRITHLASHHDCINTAGKTHTFNDAINELVVCNKRQALDEFAITRFPSNTRADFLAHIRKNTDPRIFRFFDKSKEMVRKTTKYNIYDKQSLVHTLAAKAPRGTQLWELIAEYKDAASDLRHMLKDMSIYKRDGLVWYTRQPRLRFTKIRTNGVYRQRRNMSAGMRKSMRGVVFSK